jgi:hypothetical protein
MVSVTAAVHVFPGFIPHGVEQVAENRNAAQGRAPCLLSANVRLKNSQDNGFTIVHYLDVLQFTRIGDGTEPTGRLLNFTGRSRDFSSSSRLVIRCNEPVARNSSGFT